MGRSAKHARREAGILAFPRHEAKLQERVICAATSSRTHHQSSHLAQTSGVLRMVAENGVRDSVQAAPLLHLVGGEA